MPLTLLDCKNHLANVFDIHNRNWTTTLEQEGKAIVGLLGAHGNSPDCLDLEKVYYFLIDVEKWKANCDQDKIGNADHNPSEAIWKAFLGALNAHTDPDKLLSIMQLKGFGSTTDGDTGKRRAKRASAVLRFFDPEKWGVVDWRVAEMLCLFDKNKGDIERAISVGKRKTIAEAARSWDLIDEKEAVVFEERFRMLRNAQLPRTADVELAFYGASYLTWPKPEKTRRRRAHGKTY